MPSRLKISEIEQKNFFLTLKRESGQSWGELASISGVSSRTLTDWARAKFTPSEQAIKLYSKTFNIPLPKHQILAPYWYIPKAARQGGFARYKLYGPPGTRESRQKGGRRSQFLRSQDPKKYNLLGCNIKKLIPPLQPSSELAELCGILLGDGGLTDYQIRVTLNKRTDRHYVKEVATLITIVLGEKPSLGIRSDVINVILSGVNYVKALETIGLKRGNKVRNQVGIPQWILDNPVYARLCARGLIDTDGGVYFHHHSIKGKAYVNFGLTFTNHSEPLIFGVNAILMNNGFTPSLVKNKRLYIYSLKEVQRYFKIIGSSNPKHWARLNLHLNSSKK